MKINLSNFETSDVSLFDVSIVQRDVGGGKTEKEDIDCLEEYPTAKSLIISGLNQECFEYLIKHYGSQFEAISFWKNKSVSDLSPLEDLTNVKFIHFFFNQKATDLWNMERNEKLSGLSIYDFSKLHSVVKVATAPYLNYFSIGNRVWPKMEIESLKPLIHSQITHFGWWGAKILDNDYLCLADSRIKKLDMFIRHFTIDELARLVANIPDLTGEITKPYKECSIIESGEKTTYYLLCKGKRKLIKGKDDDKLKKYLEDYNSLVEKYKIEIVAKENSGLAYDIYSFGISKIFVRVKNNERRVRLENAIIQGKITMDEILNEAEKDVKSGKAMYDVYQDGGTRIYVYEDYTIIKANRLDGNKNVYIVPKDVFWGDFPTE